MPPFAGQPAASCEAHACAGRVGAQARHDSYSRSTGTRSCDLVRRPGGSPSISGWRGASLGGPPRPASGRRDRRLGEPDRRRTSGTSGLDFRAATPPPCRWPTAARTSRSPSCRSTTSTMRSGPMREAARILEPGGRFCVAIVHPINSAGGFTVDDAPDSPFVISGSYLAERPYVDDVERGGLAMSFASVHRPLEAYAEMLAATGFVIERPRERTYPESSMVREARASGSGSRCSCTCARCGPSPADTAGTARRSPCRRRRGRPPAGAA